MQKPLSTALKISLLSFSLPLLFTGNAWAKNCTETEIETYISNKNRFAFVDCGAKAVPSLLKALKMGGEPREFAAETLEYIDTGDKNIIPELIEAFKSEATSKNVRQSIGWALVVQARQKKAETVVVPVLIEALHSQNLEMRLTSITDLGLLGSEAKAAVPALISNLKHESSMIRWNAASALGGIGSEAKAAVPALMENLKNENATVRGQTASALGSIGKNAKAAILSLVELLKDKDASVRGSAAYALVSIFNNNVTNVEYKPALPALMTALKDQDDTVRAGAASSLEYFAQENEVVVPALIAALNDKSNKVRNEAAVSLRNISRKLQEEVKNLQETEKAIAVVKQIQTELGNSPEFEDARLGVDKNLATLGDRKQSFLLQSATKWVSAGKEVWLAHAAFWLALILVYPKSPQIQAIFFWNPWVRKIMGLGYVGFALTWVPFLRRKLFEPFRESLLADAGLENFKPAAYFENSDIKDPNSGEIKPIRAAVTGFKGQIVLEGASGLGKTMFLRHLCQQSQRVVVYLPATKCADGVIEAIQKKLHGEEIKDPKFLQNLIYSGAIAICIDGLNEVSADTRAKIVEFTENYFKGDIILATQPMEWTPPSTAKQFVMQPLARSHIQAFLLSRRPLIPDYAPIREQAYEQSCSRFLEQVLNDRQPLEELEATQRILSNPMDLTVIASMIATDKQPDLFRLQEQQYTVMTEEYQEKHLGREFPLDIFSEAVYQMRLKDETTLPEEQFLEELLGMERHKMVVSRQSKDSAGKPAKEWYFRHDKIAEFFIVQTFLEHPERQEQHLGDPRFRGVYFMLVNFLKLEDAIALREMLIQYAADTKDHTVSDTFVQLLRSRRVELIQAVA
ncbi:MAG: HEAT repeat domain-containing protein [Phormidesmis sp. CAN_BIN36]|nr:HEAT repeat domain-containing protein [Phormidesmis sp. CAN_BIN36]